MTLDEPITIHAKDQKIELPLKNFLRITMIYLRPLIDKYLAEVAKKDFDAYNVQRPTWDKIYNAIMEKLGIGKGSKVLI